MEEYNLQTNYSKEEDLTVDDDGSDSVLNDMTKNLEFSIPSNTLFFLGSSCYVATSIFDLNWLEKNPGYYSYDDDSKNGVDMADDDGTYYDYEYFGFSLYNITSISGASFFVLNAIIDFYQCQYNAKEIDFTTSTYLRGRDILCDYMSAILFGAGALTDVASFLLSAHRQVIAAIIASNIYFLSSIPALINIMNSCQLSSPPHGGLLFSMIGDILFFVGSLIDLGISYISDPDLISVNKTWIYGMSVLSSVLWLVDAMLYLAADCWVFHKNTQPKNDQIDGERQSSPILLRSTRNIGWSASLPSEDESYSAEWDQGDRPESPPRWRSIL